MDRGSATSGEESLAGMAPNVDESISKPNFGMPVRKANPYPARTEPRFKCLQCDQDFQHKGSLTRHEKTKHLEGDVPMFECEHCDYKSVRKDGLTDHMKSERCIRARKLAAENRGP
jgi:transposase-like protein